jgi:hypothetical protein
MKSEIERRYHRRAMNALGRWVFPGATAARRLFSSNGVKPLCERCVIEPCRPTLAPEGI